MSGQEVATQNVTQHYEYAIAEILFSGGLQCVRIPVSEAGITDEAEHLASCLAAAVGGWVDRIYLGRLELETVI